MIKVSIIIVTYNTLQLTKNCINSILEHTSDINFEIILVDNNSTDGSKECFEKHTHISYIYLNENLGFGKANNIGVADASGEYVFFLNSDTILFENSIHKMITFFEEDETAIKIGALGCILIDENLNPNGSGSHFPTCKAIIIEYLYQIPPLRIFVKKPQDKLYPFEKLFFKIDYIIGADLLMRKAIFDKLGGFYKEYFMYFEETDLQYQMNNILGLSSYIYTGTKIIHLAEKSGATIKNYNNRKRIISRFSTNIYLKRNDPTNFKLFSHFERFFLFLSTFNRKYSREENLEFISEIKKTLSNEN